MIFEHEIPSNSRLYFSKSAKLKREIENICANKLIELGFNEIVTPYFSYHQQEIFNDSRSLIRLNDSDNSEVSLRADSTVDVVRIVTKRLKSQDIKKWFYIQPVFYYPTIEQYQVGAEIIDGSFLDVAKSAIELLNILKIDSIFQLANIAIANLLINKYNFNIEDIKTINLQKILSSNYNWIESLVKINRVEDLQDLSIYPDDIATELLKLTDVAKELNYKNILISPLYYAPFKYYDSLVFKSFSKNSIFAIGGTYNIKGVKGAGFALYLDTIIAKKM